MKRGLRFATSRVLLLPDGMPIMLWRWVRASLRRIGIELPFPGVICVEGTQTISLDEEWRASITTRRKLVFVEPPSAGDLRDTYWSGPGRSTLSVLYSSPDSVELGREERTPGVLSLYWWPKDPVTLYTIYEHEYGWRPTMPFNAAALCFEYTCDTRTGVFSFECDGPMPFEAAVVFKRPRWPRTLTEQATIERALARLASGQPRPQLTDDGKRVTCEIRGAKVGERYVLVAFRTCGVADCERWLQERSFFGRAQRLLDNWAQALRG